MTGGARCPSPISDPTQQRFGAHLRPQQSKVEVRTHWQPPRRKEQVEGPECALFFPARSAGFSLSPGAPPHSLKAGLQACLLCVGGRFHLRFRDDGRSWTEGRADPPLARGITATEAGAKAESAPR